MRVCACVSECVRECASPCMRLAWARERRAAALCWASCSMTKVRARLSCGRMGVRRGKKREQREGGREGEGGREREMREIARVLN